jgi:microcystin-dependent protein
MGPESYIASVAQFAGNFAPKGWARCDGQLLDIQHNAALFSLLGTTYGGDGIRNFALPKMNEATQYQEKPIWCICLYGIFPPRD